MKVLVIEDDPSLREIICRSLEKERYVTEEAPDFQTALEKTADYTFDCILLDIMLPDGNGLDLLEELKKENKKENIIIISAKDSLEDKVTGAAASNSIVVPSLRCTSQIGRAHV